MPYCGLYAISEGDFDEVAINRKPEEVPHIHISTANISVFVL